MKMTRVLSNFLSTLLASDTGTLANASAMKVGLITAPFAPGLGLLMADLTITTETGLVALAGTAGAQNESVDPVTGDLIVEIKPPAGGFRWETPGGFTGPITVYGFALGNNAMSVLYGTEALVEPIELNGENQQITAPALQFRIDSTKVN